jgi:hypothetical protein
MGMHALNNKHCDTLFESFGVIFSNIIHFREQELLLDAYQSLKWLEKQMKMLPDAKYPQLQEVKVKNLLW